MAATGKAEAKGMKVELTGGTNGEDRGQQAVTTVKTTVAGVRPPRLCHDNPLPMQVAVFCRAYKEYRRSIEIANEDGESRTPACVRELVPNSVQEFVCFKYYRGKPRDNLTDDELLKGLEKMAGIDEVVIEARKFKQDMFRILQMDPKLPVQARVQHVQQSLIAYLTNNELADTVRPRGRWLAGWGKIVVDAILYGVAPEDFKRDVRDKVEFEQLGNDPNGVIDVLDSMVERRKIMEEGMRRLSSQLAQASSAGGVGQKTGGKTAHNRGPGLKGGSGTVAMFVFVIVSV